MLDQYAPYVLAAYAVTGLLIGGLIAVSVLRSAKVRRDLQALERRDG
ncbi:heme exporter protein CcmD [Roseobacter sp. HKCCA0434]|nr:heme exporter protein CcmD [Roseobacter sp. HKCCA0434]